MTEDEANPQRESQRAAPFKKDSLYHKDVMITMDRILLLLMCCECNKNKSKGFFPHEMKRTESTKSGISEAQSRKEMIVDDKEHTTEPVIKWKDVEKGKKQRRGMHWFSGLLSSFQVRDIMKPQQQRER